MPSLSRRFAVHRAVVSAVVFTSLLAGCGEPLMESGEDVGMVHQAVQYEGFEQGSGGPTTNFVPLYAGNTSIPGWTISGGGVDHIITYWTSAEGSRSLDLNAESPGAVSATYYTWPGNPVSVSFSLAGNPMAGPAVKRLQVEANGYLQDYEFDTTGRSIANMGWTRRTFSYVPSGYTTVLTFRSLTTGAAGPALDNVYGGTSLVY